MYDPLDQLSAAQRTCLRLVALNRSSKEIAKEIGLSPQTVDQYLSRAAATLGVSTRREAARLFSALERDAFNKSEFKTDEVVVAEKSPSMDGPSEAGGARRTWTWFAKRLPPIGGERHDLTPLQTVYAILRVSIFTMGTAGAIIAIVFWLNRLLL